MEAGLSRSWSGKSRALVVTTTATKLQREQYLYSMTRAMLIYSRFFTRSLKLDYPNTETSKASKKYVRAMKSLHVRSSPRPAQEVAKQYIGGHPSSYSV